MNYEQFAEKFNIHLTDQQTDAVKSVEGAVLLLAVPGSGKTTVLVARLGYMIHCASIEPESILTMTYTVAATHDMRARFSSFFGDELGRRLEFRTINGVCSKIIHSYEQASGSHAFELITDEKETAALVSAIYRSATGTFPTESDIKTARTLITYAKNMMLSEKEIKKLDRQCSRFSEIYSQYCSELRRKRLMDYDDQLVYAYNILRRYPSILSRLQDRFRYICVDEAQDTSRLQHKIIELLAERNGNLFMVGDEDQSVYGFRAAYPDALTTFEQQYSGAKVLLMEQNFRSNGIIVRAADRFISKNTGRHEKNMQSSRPDGDAIAEIKLRRRIEQYERIISEYLQYGRETAVLYRDNESSLPLIDLLERREISYRVRAGDLTFFTHRVVQDIRAILNFAANPHDTELFMQIYYKLSTYLNKNLACAACDIARQENITVWDALFLLEELSAGTQRGCSLIKAQMEKLLLDRADQAISRIYSNMGYREYLDRMSIKPHKVHILEAIGANEPSPAGLLRRLDELERICRSADSKNGSRLILSTIHSSKGLEYDTVFLIDACDGIFPETVVRPGQHADKELRSIYEEERRLFYVGVTRAKERLYLFTYGDSPSYFCSDLLGRLPADRQYEVNRTVAMPVPASALTTDDADFDSFAQKCTVSESITHKFFGKGTIISRTGDIILAEFAGGQQKKLSLHALFQQGLIRP